MFSSGGGQTLADQYNLPFLGSVPIDPAFVLMIENQHQSESTLVENYKTSSLFPIFSSIVDTLLTANNLDEGLEQGISKVQLHSEAN